MAEYRANYVDASGLWTITIKDAVREINEYRIGRFIAAMEEDVGREQGWLLVMPQRVEEVKLPLFPSGVCTDIVYTKTCRLDTRCAVDRYSSI
jgi:hypothetical protein